VTSAELLALLEGSWPSFTPTAVDQEYGTLLGRLGLPATLTVGRDHHWQLNMDGLVSLTGTLTTTVLGVAGEPVYIQFAPAGTKFVMLIDLALPASWTFGQSFALLKGGALDGLRLADPATEQSALVIATGQAMDPLRSADGVGRLLTAGGLTFCGWFDPSSPALGPVSWLLTGAGASATAGPIGYDATTGAVDMQLALATGTATNLLGAGTHVELTASVVSAKDPGLDQYVSGIRLETELELPPTIRLAGLVRDADGGILDLTLSSDAFALPSAAAIERLFGAGNGVEQALPSQFESVAMVQDVTFSVGLLSHQLESVMLRVGVPAGHPWSIGGLSVDAPLFAFMASKPLEPAAVQYMFGFTATLTLAGVARLIVAGRTGSSGPTVITGRLDDEPDPPALATLVSKQLGRTNGLPADELAVRDIAFEANLSESAYSGEIEVDGEWPLPFGWDGEVTLRELRIAFSLEDGTPGGELAARLALGGADFHVKLAMGEDSSTFEGEWEADLDPPGAAGAPDYQDIAVGLGLYGLPDLPAGLDLSVEAASFKFDSAAPSFAFKLATSAFGFAALVAGEDSKGNWGFLFGALVPLDLGLSIDIVAHTPLGRVVPAGAATIAIDQLRIVGASSAMPPLPAHLDSQSLEAIGEQPSSGLALAVALKVGSLPQTELEVRFGGPNDRSAEDVPPPTTPSTRSLPTKQATPAPQSATVSVQRAFGPLQFNRIDFAITPALELAIGIDAAVALGGLRIGLAGLRARVPVNGSQHRPTFELAGLAVDYRGGGLSIGGGLVAVPGSQPEWVGMLTMSYGRFAATATGTYTTAAGQPSLYVFVWVDYPIGGPPIFFVTGLAGGFGFNRSLRLPSIAGVADYPLVKGAAPGGSQSATALALAPLISPAVGQSWAAAGIHFTSFGMIDSSVLATLSFGAHVELALMGRSIVTVPPSTSTQPIPPVAQATVMLLVDVDPALGQLAVDAQLTPQSYVLSREAKLTGGLAFYAWFASSPHAGDFVLTLGGYSPWFTRPAHYPTVPRLGLNWKLDNLTVKGGLYFALTPAVLMLGGTLEATWKSGDIEAWFTAQADFLARFKPFGYSAELNVSIGAAYTVNLLWTSKRITAHVGVRLNLWGPPFGGRAYVDLSLISFTLAFGAQPLSPPPAVGWSEFRESFLPSLNSAERARHHIVVGVATRDFPAPIYETDSLITIGVPAGLLRAGGEEESWLVDPAAVRLVVGLQVPSTSATLLTPESQQVGPAWNGEFGVGPMRVAARGANVALEIQVAGPAGAQETWVATPLTGNVPKALWLDTEPTLPADPLVRGVLTGVELKPSPPAASRTAPVQLEKLAAGAAPPPQRHFEWSATTPPTSDSFAADDALSTLRQKLLDPAVASSRSAILAALAAQGLETATTVELVRFAGAAEQLLASPPLLRLLGEQAPAGAPG
jgi:hypothetical protein